MSKNSVLAVTCGVVAMTVLDLSVVNVALPSIQADLLVAGVGLLAAASLLGGLSGTLGRSDRRPRGHRHRAAATGRTTPSAITSRESAVTSGTSSSITAVATVFVPVADQDRSPAFSVDLRGFERRVDFTYGGSHRWVEVAPLGSAIALALVAPGAGISVDRVTTRCVQPEWTSRQNRPPTRPDQEV